MDEKNKCKRMPILDYLLLVYEFEIIKDQMSRWKSLLREGLSISAVHKIKDTYNKTPLNPSGTSKILACC